MLSLVLMLPLMGTLFQTAITATLCFRAHTHTRMIESIMAAVHQNMKENKSRYLSQDGGILRWQARIKGSNGSDYQR